MTDMSRPVMIALLLIFNFSYYVVKERGKEKVEIALAHDDKSVFK